MNDDEKRDTAVAESELNDFLRVSEVFLEFLKAHGPEKALKLIETLAKSVIHYECKDDPIAALAISADFGTAICDYIQDVHSKPSTEETVQ